MGRHCTCAIRAAETLNRSLFAYNSIEIVVFEFDAKMRKLIGAQLTQDERQALKGTERGKECWMLNWSC